MLESSKGLLHTSRAGLAGPAGPWFFCWILEAAPEQVAAGLCGSSFGPKNPASPAPNFMDGGHWRDAWALGKKFPPEHHFGNLSPRMASTAHETFPPTGKEQSVGIYYLHSNCSQFLVFFYVHADSYRTA